MVYLIDKYHLARLVECYVSSKNEEKAIEHVHNINFTGRRWPSPIRTAKSFYFIVVFLIF
jgi:hypothetical protein